MKRCSGTFWREQPSKGCREEEVRLESEWIDSARRGDAAAFEALMSAYERKVYCLCLRMMGNAQDGEDAAQEAMLRIWQRISQYRGESAFSTWVYRVTASVCTDALRRRSLRAQPSLDAMREAGFDPGDDAPTPQQAVEAGERRQAMQRAIDEVPEQMRSVFLMRDVHGLSVQETAQALGISSGTVKSRLSRARERIAASLRRSGIGGRDGFDELEVRA